MDKRRLTLLRQIGSVLRGDWSMRRYDGRDIQRWIDDAIDGTDADLDALEDLLTKLESDW